MRILGLLFLFRTQRDLLAAAESLIVAQAQVIESKSQEAQQWRELTLAASRSCRDLALAARFACDRPDIDIRESLDAVIKQWSDATAHLEEHIL